MIRDYIEIAVSHILSEYNNGIERCCGSCNPSCDDLTRFICFGHSVAEINEWIKNNRASIEAEYNAREQKFFDDFITKSSTSSHIVVDMSKKEVTIE